MHFITFNYDFSLEEHLFNSLRAIDTFDDGDINKFLAERRILHVYGSIRDVAANVSELKENGFLTESSLMLWLGLGDEEPPQDARWIKFLEVCHAASQKIRTIDSHDKIHEPSLGAARNWIAAADRAYILGYGFDEANNERIGLGQLAASSRNPRHVYFTNFNNTNTVNKKVGQMTGHYRSFLQESIVSNSYGNVFEKSVRNVYDALELDFGIY